LKKYETIIILDEKYVEDQGKQFSEQFLELVKELGGNIVETVPMGKKQFTYQIKKRKAGVYWDFIYELLPSKVAAITEKYRLDERILRLRTYDV
jgi:small subunit ribosomal protein S6